MSDAHTDLEMERPPAGACGQASIGVVRKGMAMFEKVNVPILGIVENMVGGALKGTAADELAREFGVRVFARVPWHPSANTWDRLAVIL